MLFLAQKFIELPLATIRSGGRIGTISSPIINPHNLHIDGFYCQTIHDPRTTILLDIDVRDISARGIIIDDHDDLSDPNDLVRLDAILKLNFSLFGKQAFVNKSKVGNVIDFAVDTSSLYIQKIYVRPPLWKSFGQDQLTFDRQSIIEITDDRIVFSGPEVRQKQSLQDSVRLNPLVPNANPEPTD